MKSCSHYLFIKQLFSYVVFSLIHNKSIYIVFRGHNSNMIMSATRIMSHKSTKYSLSILPNGLTSHNQESQFHIGSRTEWAHESQSRESILYWKSYRIGQQNDIFRYRSILIYIFKVTTNSIIIIIIIKKSIQYFFKS